MGNEIELKIGKGAKAIAIQDYREFIARKRSIMPEQTHSINIGIVEDRLATFPETDALITTERNLPIGVKTADCVPILLNATGIGAVAAIHAGWKGTLGGIVAKTIDKLVEMGESQNKIFAAIGPSICGECYEVSQELAEQFMAHGFEEVIIRGKGEDPYGKKTFTEKSFRIDLKKANEMLLLKNKVPSENIYISDICTRHSVTIPHPWPSWRRCSGTSERLGSFIWLE